MRQSKDLYYLGIAKAVAARGTCLRRNFGAVLVKDDSILSTGYTGPPRGAPHCNVCKRESLGVEPGTRYELCESVHGELNAIINAARAGVSTIGATMYTWGSNYESGVEVMAANPCMMCARAIKNAGVVRVVGKTEKDEIVEWDFDTTY